MRNEQSASLAVTDSEPLDVRDVTGPGFGSEIGSGFRGVAPVAEVPDRFEDTDHLSHANQHRE
jgi:hypothetical protein